MFFYARSAPLTMTMLLCLALRTGDVPVCDPKRLCQCVFEALKSYVREDEAEKCDCPHQCRQLTYTPIISQSQLSISAASHVKRVLNVTYTVDEIIHDYCVAEVGISIIALRLFSFVSDVTIETDV